MSFRQLYYTSCETGLSGYAGYQFNAVTAGTSTETMRAVEALTSYEPPHSRAQASSPEELALSPVNLCFAPGAAGAPAVLACVAYVGRDSSNRVGNYFAHALATDDLDADDPQLLPIELWRAPWWQRTASADTTLPPMAGPLPTGPLSRDQAASFLEQHPHRDKITALLTAAGLARSRNDRSVLVVAESTDEVALWFAAACYLLPPGWVRRLSFSTYLSRPSRSRLHLLGTLPETNLDLGPDADERFYLFDFPGQRFAAPADHPLARLCVAIGVRALPSIWGWADALAGGAEATLDDWHPVVAAAAALGRVPLAAGDLDAVTGWLASRADLDRATRIAVAEAVHSQREVTDDVRRGLRDVSAQAEDADLWEQVQYELLEPLLRARADGQQAWSALTGAAVPPRLADAAGRVRGQLSATVEEELRLAESPADTLSLLDWSGQAGLPVDGDLLADCGRRVLGPLLAADDGAGRLLPARQREEAARVAQRWPQVREGLVAYLTGLAGGDPAGVATALRGLVGQLLTAGDTEPGSSVRVYYLVHDGLRRRAEPTAILAGLAARAEIGDVDALLLCLLWPSEGWTVAEAAQVLARVDAGVLGGAADWFEATVDARPERDQRAAYATLCSALMESPLAGELATRPRLGEVADLWRSCKSAQRVADLDSAIRACRASSSAAAAVLACEWLSPLIAGLPAGSPHEILSALSGLSAPALSRYLTLISDRFKRPSAGATLHAAALYLVLIDLSAATDWARPHDERINDIMVWVARWWSKEQLERTARLIDGVRASHGESFRDQVGLVRAGRLSGVIKVARVVRRLRPGPARAGRDGVAPADGTAGPEG